MTKNQSSIDMFKARHEPSLVFDSPGALANDARLSSVQKLELLELWEGSAKRENEYNRSQSADARPPILDDIAEAIAKVDKPD